MDKLSPIPEVGQIYWFYADDLVKKDNEFEARITDVYTYEETAKKFVYKYDDQFQEVVPYPVMDLWLEEVMELFWILAGETDYIVRAMIPGLCPQDVYFARSLDGGWHTFETATSKQFGILDVTGELYNKLHGN